MRARSRIPHYFHEMPGNTSADIAVIGGGFYGCCLSTFLAERFRKVVLLERSDDLLTRASFVNQARVHNGYHYPRSFLTAVRSAVNFPRFVADFADCIYQSFDKLYAIPREDSKVNAAQFLAFCRNINAPVKAAPPALRSLFDLSLVEDIFAVRECAFDAARLRNMMLKRMTAAGVEVHLQETVERVEKSREGGVRLALGSGGSMTVDAAFNCTYSQLNTLLRNSGVSALSLKHQITEIALIEPHAKLRHVGITVMDGPFFSTMPFPALSAHSLTHVRYTPHESWVEPDGGLRDPQAYLRALAPESHYAYMLRDSRRFVPILDECRFLQSLFEVKTVLRDNEGDDGRPILFRKHEELGEFFSVLGGKLDNIYDMLTVLESMHETSRAVTT